jgi:DivIVA domain-containing protein
MTSREALTGDEVRQAVFGKPPIGKRGYHPHQVDAFLQRVAATLDGADSLTADEVHNVVFVKPPIGQRGYSEDEVDAFLDIVTVILRERAGGGQPPAAASAPAAAPAVRNAEPLSGYQVRQTVFRTAALGGYDKKQVDEFMARAADTLDGSGMPLSVEQLQGVDFERAKGLRRGYQVDDVDAMIARVTAELHRRSAGW